MKLCCKSPTLNRKNHLCFSCGSKFYDPTQVISSLLRFPENIDENSYLNSYGIWEVQGLWEFDEPHTYLGDLDVIAKLLAPKSYQGLTFKKVSMKRIDFIVPYDFSTQIETSATNKTISIMLSFDSEKIDISKVDQYDLLIKSMKSRPGVTVGQGEFPDTLCLIYT